MKVTTGGTIGFKIIAKPYEPISVSATFSYEHDNNDKLSKEEVETLNEKVNKVLEEQLKKKANVAFKIYKEARERLASIIDK